MKSHDVSNHGTTGLVKKPWVTPSLEIIALESAESGTHRSQLDGTAPKETGLNRRPKAPRHFSSLTAKATQPLVPHSRLKKSQTSRAKVLRLRKNSALYQGTTLVGPLWLKT